MGKLLTKEKIIEYEKVNGDKFKEKISILEEYEYSLTELDNEINELQAILDNMKELNSNELKDWGRKNHPFYLKSQEIKVKLQKKKELRDTLFNNKSK